MYPKNKYWNPLVNFLKKNKLENKIFIGPEVLLNEFPKVFPYQILKDISLSDFDIPYIVFHKKLPEDLTNDYLDLIKEEYKPVWGNHLFVVFKKNRSKKEKLAALKYMLYTKINFKKYYKPLKDSKIGILITTYNRPEHLIKLLAQLKNRQKDILVVNDGSSEEYFEQYQQIKQKYNEVTYIDNSKNMGLVFSLNTGFSFFLSDPDIEWIHNLQDDIIIKDNLFEETQKIADKNLYPVVTGIYQEQHPIAKKTKIKDIEVYLLRSTGAWHFMAHRQYLMENLPIPNPYVGAPKPDLGKPGQGSDADWWLFSWSPNAVIKKDKYIACIPGLCYTDMSAELSTWDIYK